MGEFMASNSEKKEKSLAEFVLIILLIGMLAAIFINYYIKQEAQYANAGFSNLAQSFNVKVATVHAQWFMDKQPSVVQVVSLNKKEKQQVSVNQFGWVDSPQEELACEKIWQLVMAQPLSVMKFTIAAIEVRNTKSRNIEHVADKVNVKGAILMCRYVLPDGRYFSYNRLNGRVTATIKMTN